MTSLRSMTICSILTLFFAEGCAANEPPKLAESVEIAAETEEESDNYIIDSQAGSVAGIAVGMTEAQIRESGWPYETRTKNLEGDEYKIYDISLADGVVLSCTLDFENTVYSIESSSAGVRDEYGLGVDSSLRELKEFYAGGRFIKGNEEGRYANFLTGTRLIFRFDHEELDDSCFDYRQECAVDDSIAVRSISIGLYTPN